MSHPDPPQEAPPPPPAAERRRGSRWDVATVMVAFSLFPVTLVTNEAVPTNPFDPQATLLNSAWLVLLVMGTISVVVHRPRPAAQRSLAPYGLFLLLAVLSLTWTDHAREGLGLLARLTTPALVYLAAWSAMSNPGTRVFVRRLASWWIGASVVSYLLLGVGDVIPAIDFPERLMALGLVMLVPIATPRPTSVAATRWLGLLAVATAVASGSRMASLAVIAVLVVSPSLGLSIARRALVAAVVLLAFVAALQTEAFQDRWFTGGGTFDDLVGIEENLDTSGRREVWQVLGSECRASWLIGDGLGSADALSAATSPGFPQPHNEYLRTYCDVGVAGSLVFWSFFLLVGWRAIGVARRDDTERAPAVAALQLLLGLFLLSLTDNPLTATLQFMAPAAVIFAWSDRLSSGRPVLRPRRPAQRRGASRSGPPRHP